MGDQQRLCRRAGDKEHADAEIIQRVWGEVNDLSEEIREGRVNVKDLRIIGQNAQIMP